jgi:hypothetical protein
MADTCGAHPVGMTASLFVTATPVLSVGRAGPEGDGHVVTAEVPVIHAVARPVVDGLESSVCGLLVTAIAARDWLTVRDASRCEECARIAG